MAHTDGIKDNAKTTLSLAASFIIAIAATLPFCAVPAEAIGVLNTPAAVRVGAHPRPIVTSLRKYPSSQIRRVKPRATRTVAKPVAKKAAKPAPKRVSSKPLQPQAFSDKMAGTELAPGVVHKYFRGPLTINLLDIDMVRSPVKIQPYLAGTSFDRLKDVAQHAKEANALAAINANYFKRDGVPLGTLIINGEWIAGPLYDRVSMGITNEGKVRVDRVSFGGTLTSDNPELQETWVNSINQPRRSGCHLFAYTRRWGASAKLPYEGCLVAIDAQGKVQDSATREMVIPYGGYVLSDSKDSPISKLQRGDSVKIDWKTTPNWDDVVEAFSGGPLLIKDGKLFLDLKAEKFRGGWTGSHIKARTVAGVTANNHLLLATVEGPHTLWDIAKFLHKMGAVDALNLDGGGSTTMVVNGKTVTRNAKSSQRRVASSIVVLDTRRVAYPAGSGNYSSSPTDAPPVAPPIVPTISETMTTNTESINVQGISASPAQMVEVCPTTTNTNDDDGQPRHHKKKKKHLFGLLGS